MSYFPSEWLNARLWPLVFVVLVPLVLHWLDRRRAPTVDWPGLRFLLVSGERAIRRLERRDLILLFVRTLAIAALVAAVLRPRAEIAAGTLSSSGRAGIVLVIDASVSMDYQPTPEADRRLERARRAALRLLDRSGKNDVVSVLALPDGSEHDPDSPLPPSAAAQLVRAITVGGAGFDLSEALRVALERARALKTANREIFIFTDLQPPPGGQDLAQREDLLKRFAADIDPAPRIYLVDCGDDDAWNVFIASLETEGIAAGTDEPARIRVEVGLSGDRPREVPLRVTAGTKLVYDAPVRATPGEPTAVEVSNSFSTGGDALVSAQTGPDGLEADDRAETLIRVLERLDVLVRDAPARGREHTGDAALRALWPRVATRSPPPTILRPRRVEALDRGSLDEAGVVVWCDVPAPQSDEADLLGEFVRGGGGAVLFCGSSIDAALYDRLFFRGGSGLLPARLGRDLADGTDASTHPVIDPRSHPVFGVFGGGDQGDLDLVRVRTHRVVETLAPGASVISRLADGSPWIIERSYGRGRVILVTTSGEGDDSDLVHTPLFPPLLHRLVRYVALGGGEDERHRVGEPLLVELPADRIGGAVTVVSPGGDSETITLPADASSLSLLAPRRPGTFRIEGKRESGASFTLFVPVALPREESRLDRFDTHALETLEGSLGARVVPVAAVASEGERDRAAATIEYWPLLGALAVFLLLFEMILARAPAPEKATEREGAGRTSTGTRTRQDSRLAPEVEGGFGP